MYKRYAKNVAVILIILIVSLSNIFVENVEVKAFAIPSSLRVGLSVVENAYEVSSASGLTYGYYNGNTYTQLEGIASNTGIFIRKDADFYNGTNLPTMYSAAGDVPAGKMKYGSYRVQIGGTLTNYSTAKSTAATYKTKFGQNCYPALSGGTWRVYTGDFASSAEAANCVNSLKAKDSQLTYTNVTRQSGALIITNKNYETLLFFNSETYKFTVKPNTATIPLLKLGTKSYRGYLEFRRLSGRDITVINTLAFNEYLYGVLPTEVPAYWNQPETFKAQAVTARNFAYINSVSSKHASHDFHVCSTSDCQNYGGYSSENASLNSAVNATQGQLLLYNGSPASIYYSASNGGYTEGTENVWSATMAYYKTLLDQYDPVEYRLYTMTAAEASATLKAKGYDVGDLKSIEIRKRSESGRVLEMVVTGTTGSKTILKNATRGAFGLRNQMFKIRTDTVYTLVQGSFRNNILEYLNGTKYGTSFITAKTYTMKNIPGNGIKYFNNFYYEKIVINSQSDNIYFDVYGNGHGVGMSQWGAKKMAELGKNYKEIMSFYYPGTVVG